MNPNQTAPAIGQTVNLASLQATSPTPASADTSPAPVTPIAAPQIGQTVNLADLQKQAAPTGQPVTPPDPSAQNRIINSTGEVIKSGAEQFAAGTGQIYAGLNDGSILSGLQQVGRGILNEAVGASSVAFSPIAGPVLAAVKSIQESPLAPVVKLATDAYTNNVSQPVANKVNELLPGLQNFVAANPNSEEIVSNAINLGMLFVGGGKAPEIQGALKEGGQTISDTIDAAGNKISNAVQTPLDTIRNIGAPKSDTAQLQSVADDWAKPLETNSPQYKNARAVVEKDPEVTQFIAQQGANPFEHIEDGKYVTKDTAETFREKPAEYSNQYLRPALKAADYTAPKMAVSDIKATVDSGGHAITPDDAESIDSLISKKVDALQRKYPDGMSLEQRLDERITFDQNGGYKEYKDAAENNSAIANRSIANYLRDNLNQAGKELGLPIQDFQSHISKFYRAADYLEALNGKKAPVSIGQMIARNVAKFGGAKAAELVGGNDLVSSFLGYQIGKNLERIIENMTNPMRDAFLKDLKVSDPEAFRQVKAFTDHLNEQAASSVKLPAGKPLGSEGNPIVTPAPKPAEPVVRSVPAKAISVKNPKTGKFEKAYTSEEKVTKAKKPK